MDALIEELEEYANLENTEVGEYWAALIRMRDHSDAMGDAFSVALDTEIKEQVEFIRNNFEIVEETVENSTRKVRYLDYIG